MFAYCRNNPVSRKDSCGTEDEDITEKMDALLEKYAKVDEFGLPALMFLIQIYGIYMYWLCYLHIFNMLLSFSSPGIFHANIYYGY